MSKELTLEEQKKYNKFVVVVSIVVPLAVAALFGINLRRLGFDIKPLSFLPPIYASVNALTAILLVISLIAIKNGKKKLHEAVNKLAIFCSLLFLLMYIAYHMTSDSTSFGGQGAIRIIYYFILITHIILSIIIIPFVLITFFRAHLGNFDAHKKISRITFPLWLYVAVTGVIVYLMISPYYIH